MGHAITNFSLQSTHGPYTRVFERLSRVRAFCRALCPVCTRPRAHETHDAVGALACGAHTQTPARRGIIKKLAYAKKTVLFMCIDIPAVTPDAEPVP